MSTVSIAVAKNSNYILDELEVVEPLAHKRAPNTIERVKNNDVTSWVSTDQHPNKNVVKTENGVRSPQFPPIDYFYECNFYPYDWDGDGEDDSIEAEFDVDTLESYDYVTVEGYLYDDYGYLIDGPYSISYGVYGQEWDYEYLYFTALDNGLPGWDYYHVELYLYDSNWELDDWWISDDYYLYVYSDPYDYFYECTFYPYDWDGDGYDDSIEAEFDVDTFETMDLVTVEGRLYDTYFNLVDGPTAISYWVYGQEWDYEYLDFTVCWNGTVGWDEYYVALDLYDSTMELDDWWDSEDFSLYNKPDDYFYSCTFEPYDDNGDGLDDSIEAEFDVDTYEISDYVTVEGYLYDDSQNLIDGPKTVSYWVYGYEYDFEHLTFTALYNGSSDWHEYYVDLYLYDSLQELDDTWISDMYSLYVPSSVKEWTFMVYLDADNNLEAYGINDFLEMASVGSTDNINIVVQFDRISGYDSRYDNWYTTKRYLVEQGMVPDEESALLDLGEANMGDPQTLIDFVTWGIDNYPAQKYCVVLWDHGSGWMDGPGQPIYKGVCEDWSSGDVLTTLELKPAMNVISNHIGSDLDILGFDACLMAMIEVEYQVHNSVDIVVASEEIEPGPGWPYDDFLSTLASNPNMSPEALSTEIVEDYLSYYGYSTKYTLSAIDIQELSIDLVPKVDLFALMLRDYFHLYYYEIFNARGATESFEYYEYCDLYDFADEIVSRITEPDIVTAAQDVMDAIDTACIAEEHGSGSYGAHGLSIYWPTSYYDDDYDLLDFAEDTNWEDFLKIALGINNLPPYEPSDPNPPDFATDITLNPELSVDVTDPNGYLLTVSFYEHPSNDLIAVDYNVASGSRASIVWPNLDPGTVYMWYTIADDGTYSTTSDIWGFTTIDAPNQPPDAPTDPLPEDMATGVELNPELSVLVSDPDEDPMDIAFYDAAGPTLIDIAYSIASGTRASVVWPDLEYGTTYSWYAIAFDGEECTSSDTWQFDTMEEPNNPPNTPFIPSGPTPVYADYSWEYMSGTTDPEAHNVFYRWDWGDELTEWIGPYESGQDVTEGHSWLNPGDYDIRVQAKDDPNGDHDPEDGLESPWSDYFLVHVQYTGDINDDGVVNVEDLFEVLAQWEKGRGSADINGDGVVNVQDLIIVLSHWTQ